MNTLYSNLIVSLATPVIEAYRAGNTALAQQLLHNKIAEHNSVALAVDLTQYIHKALTK